MALLTGALAPWGLAAPAGAASVAVSTWGDQVIDARGLTLDDTRDGYGIMVNGQSFTQSVLTTAGDYQFAAYWVQMGTSKYVAVARRPVPVPGVPSAGWSVVDLPGSQFSNSVADSHNVVSIGVDPTDGTIHLAYDMHGHNLKYVKSAVGAATGAAWDATLFNAQTSALINTTTVTGVTYPQFVRMPTGGLQLYFRKGGSGNGSMWVYNYNNSTHQWTDGHPIDNGSAGTYVDRFGVSHATRNDYPNGFTYDASGRLHHTFTYRESGGTYGNHDIMYVYSDDNGMIWKNNDGTVVANASTGLKYTVTSPGLVVREMPAQSDMINQQGQNVDHQNHIHTIFSHLDTTKSPQGVTNYSGTYASYYVYWRDDLGNWHRNRIPGSVGSRPKIFFDADDNAIAIYNQGSLRIATATKAHNWTDWTVASSVPNAGGYGSEAQADSELINRNGILSVFMQDSPATNMARTDVHSLDYEVDFATQTTKTFQAASGSFTSSSNWSSAGVPGNSHDAVIDGGRTANLTSWPAASIGGDVALGTAAGSGTLNLTAGGMTVWGSLIVGKSGAGAGLYHQSAGTVNIHKRLVVGDFTSETSGGGVSSALISGGTLACTEVQIAMSANGSSSGSTLTISGSAEVEVSGEVIIADAGNTGTLQLNGGIMTVAGDMITGWNQANTSRLNLEGGTLDMTGNSVQVTNLSLKTGRLQNVRNLNDGETIVKDSPGAMAFAGVNDITNDFVIKNGTLRAESTDALGAGSLQVAGGANTGALELTGGITLHNDISLSGRSSASLNNAPHIVNGAGNNTLMGDLAAYTDGKQYTLQSNAGVLTVGGNYSQAAGTGNRYLYLTGSGNGVVTGYIANGTALIHVIKQGTGTWSLSGANTYTGSTILEEGTLAITGFDARAALTDGVGFTDVKGRLASLVYDYANQTDPTAQLKDLLTAGYQTGFKTASASAPIFSSQATDQIGLGWINNPASSQLTIRPALYGDANLDGTVNLADYHIWFANQGSGSVWAQGDFNYDGQVNGLDYNLWQSNKDMSLVPEPMTFSMVTLASLLLLRRRPEGRRA